MKILYFVAVYQDFTGSHRSLGLMASRLPAGFETVVVLPADGRAREGFERMGLRTIVAPAPSALNVFEKRLLRIGRTRQALTFLKDVLPYAFSLRRLIRRERADIVHCNDSRAVLLAGWAAKLAGAPVVWHLRGYNQLGPHSMLNRIVGSLSNKVVPVAHALVDETLPNDKVRVIYNGIDDSVRSSYDAGAEMTRMLSDRGLSPDAVKIVTASSLVPFKGHHHVLEALKMLFDEDPYLRVAWFALGDTQGDDRAKYAAHLRSRAEELGVANNVFFAGWSDESLAWLAAADIVVLPTVQRERFTYPDGETLELVSTEGFPRVVLEAMLSGRAILASDVAGVTEAVKDGRSALVVAPGDAKALAAALGTLVADEGLRLRLGAAAREDVGRFSLEATVAETVNLYEELKG